MSELSIGNLGETAPMDGPASLDDSTKAELRRQTERWFIRRGVPHLIEGYNAREDILTRIAPFLSIVFLFEVLLAPNVDFPWWGNVAAVGGSVAAVIAVIVVINKVRGRRRFQRPDTIGFPEVAAFLLVPPLLPLAFGLQWAQAVETVVTNVVLLVVSYFVASYGLFSTVRWALGQLVRQLRNVGPLLARSLPLLLLITMFMFFNAELWKVVDDLPHGFLIVALAILVLSGSLFVVLFLRSEVNTTNRFSWWSEVRDAAAGTPLAEVAVDGLHDPPQLAELSRRERLNVGLVLFFTQAVQIAVVTIGITFFYVVFGSVTIIDTTIVQWTGSEAIDIFWQFDLFGGEVVISGELVRTALFVGAIAGLQFTVSALTDTAYRQQFNDEITTGLHKVMAVRALYRVL